MNSSAKIENVIIIGGGPAGLSAAIYNSRAGLNPLVFAGSPPGGQLTLTTEVENFPGFEHILGPDLIMKMRSHASKFGTKIIDQNIVKVELNTSPFTIWTSEKEYKTKALLVATGAKALWLGLDSETRLRGKGVSACATCDGFFFRNKTVAVVGGGDTAMEEALVLTKFAAKVYLIHRRDVFRASKIMIERVKNHPKIELVLNTTIKEILGNLRVEGVRISKLNKEDVFKLDGVFIAIGHKPDTELFGKQISLDEKGYILTFNQLAEKALRYPGSLPASALERIKKFKNLHSYSTSVEGVFAAGDCVDHAYRQAITAAGMGAAAGIEVERWLES